MLSIKKNKNRNGLFTDQFHKKNDILLRINGKIIPKINIENLSSTETYHYLQIGLDKFLDMSNTESFFINHSCNPNCYIKIAVNNVFLIAYRDIRKDEELLIDYSLTSTEDEKTFNLKCDCGAYNCRKIISGFYLLPENIKNKYLNDKIIQDYLLNK